MQYLTLEQVRNKVLKEHDLQEMSFIDLDEIDGYFREAIDIAESIIVGLYEDYYLDKTEWLPLSTTVNLPTNIYANKLRKVTIRTGPQDEFGVQIYKNTHLSPTKLGYNIYNKSNQNPQLVFENLDTSFTEYQLQYTRNANRPVNNSDVIDVPEVAIYFVTQYVKVRCFEKERDPLASVARDELRIIKDTMVDALSNIVDDGSEILKPDVSFYNEFDDWYNSGD